MKIKEIVERHSRSVLETVVIHNQEEIIARTGKPLDPVAAYDRLVSATKGFTENSTITDKVDELLTRLVMRSLPSDSVPSDQEATFTKQEVLASIEAQETMLEFLEGNEKQEYIDSIEAQKVMLEFL